MITILPMHPVRFGQTQDTLGPSPETIARLQEKALANFEQVQDLVASRLAKHGDSIYDTMHDNEARMYADLATATGVRIDMQV